MPAAPKPENESQRLDALWSYEILDTSPEAGYNALSALAAEICGAPIAIVSLVDADRQWFKSQCGLGDVESTGRDIAFCAYAILQKDIFEVPDATLDPRFATNPLVTGEPYIRFYAGVPLVEPGGMALGSLCVIDQKPRLLSAAQRQSLMLLAEAVVELIVARSCRSQADDRRMALLDTALAQARDRTAQLRVLRRLGESLASAQRPDDGVALALTAALQLIENTRGSIVEAAPDRDSALPASGPFAALARISAGARDAATIVLSRDESVPFTPTERLLLELIASMTSLAQTSRFAPV